jgi:hypothetical protein
MALYKSVDKLITGTLTLTSNINSVVTSFDLTGNLASVPTDKDVVMRMNNELMLITDISGQTITVTRGALGSTASSHTNTDEAKLIMSAEMYNGLVVEVEGKLADDAATVKARYESNADTNAFSDSDSSKLSGIEALAQVNVALASQAEAEAGIENTKTMTALRVAEAIAALAGSTPIYGSERQSTKNNTVVAHTGTYQDHSTISTGTLPAGTYEVEASALYTGNTQSRTNIRFALDPGNLNVELNAQVDEMKDTVEIINYSYKTDVVLGVSGPIELALQHSNTNGVGEIRQSQIFIKRVL